MPWAAASRLRATRALKWVRYKVSRVSPLAALLAVIVVLPILSVAGSVLRQPSPSLSHLAATILPEVLWNTLVIGAVTAIGCAAIGAVTAWLVVMFEFPGSRALQWLLLLPLAIPGYIVGYAYSDFLSFAGPVQSGLRATFGWSKGDYWFPETQGVGGASLMFVLVLYPYVYLLARTAFLEQSTTTLEVARTLGAGPWSRFLRVGLPAARPAVVAGTSLALMETLADFGMVQYFGVHTFTTLIFRTWLGMGDPVGAGQLASMLLLFVFGLLALERSARSDRRHHRNGGRDCPIVPARLTGWRAAAATAACLTPVVLGFVVPVAILLRLHVLGGDDVTSPQFLRLISNSVVMAAAAATLVSAIAFALAHVVRLHSTTANRNLTRLATMGYAVPGTVIAVGLLVPIGAIDRALGYVVSSITGSSAGLIVGGTFLALLFAYLVRFLAVASGSFEAGYAKLPLSMDHAARSLGAAPGTVLWQIHTPLLKRAGLTAFVLVFADILKELPATLILRPFNYDTLAVRVYNLASDERLSQAATSSLMIVAVGLLPIILLTRAIAVAGDRQSGRSLELV